MGDAVYRDEVSDVDLQLGRLIDHSRNVIAHF